MDTSHCKPSVWTRGGRGEVVIFGGSSSVCVAGICKREPGAEVRVVFQCQHTHGVLTTGATSGGRWQVTTGIAGTASGQVTTTVKPKRRHARVRTSRMHGHMKV